MLQYCWVIVEIFFTVYLIQFLRIAIFMSLHGPDGISVLVANASPSHVPPIQCVLKHCGVHIITYACIYDPKQSKDNPAGGLRLPAEL